MNPRETAISLGIRLGKVVKRIEWIVIGKREFPVERVNTITLSGGDANWDSVARHLVVEK